MNTLTRTLVLGLAASAFTLAGCATTGNSLEACEDCTDPNCTECATESASIGAVNESCPFSGKPVNADIETASFQGQEIGFCCNGCVEKFENMTDTERTSLLGM